MYRFFPSRLLAWFLALSVIVSCGGDEPIDPTPVTPVTPVDPNPPTPEKDTTAPTITVSRSTINVISGPSLTVSGNELKIGEELVASWKDDKSTSCTVAITFTPTEGTTKTVNSGDKLEEEGKLQVKVSDEAGNSSEAEIALTKTDSEAPKIEILIQEKNVIAGVKVSIQDNQLLFDDVVAATWTDDYSTTFTTVLTLVSEGGQSKALNSGDILFDAGKLSLTVADESNNNSTAEIPLTAIAITGLENLQNLALQVDQEVNLLQGLTIAEGLTLSKVEIEENGERRVLPNPNAYTPEYPGVIWLVITLERKDGSTIEVQIDGLHVMGLSYSPLEIIDFYGKDLFPQVEIGDLEVYDHIDHIRVGEATRVIDMMWEYGAGGHTPQQYQQLMGRLNTGLLWENPKGTDEYVIVGDRLYNDPSEHAYVEWSILTSLIKHATIIVIDTWYHWEDLYELCKSNPDKINIMGLSKWAIVDREAYDLWEMEVIKEYIKEKNYLVFCSAGNIGYQRGIFFNKLYQEDYNLPDEHSWYGAWSCSHNRKDNVLDRHIMITVATDKHGDIDQTYEIVESSLFPVGFHNKVLFSWRILPYKREPGGQVRASSGKYATSFTNYVNVALADICFQMYAEVKDVNELLEMIRSTAATDYIRFDLNGDGDTNDDFDDQLETQPLQLINPGGFFKKYLTPQNLPVTISTSENVNLEKGYYKGVIFDIPGAEVLIDGQWIAYDNKNKDIILSQNPMNLSWRINGNLLRKMGYSSGQTVQGQIVTVDDQWNGLRMEVPMTITIQ